MIRVEGTGENPVPYYGYVEVNVKTPQITKYKADVLMLVFTDTLYGERVPVQIGTTLLE